MAFLTIEKLVLGYESKAILPPLSFQVQRGDYLCIVGENGSGKTTLIRTVLHLQPPISGQIIMGDGLKADEIGYLPQQTVIQKDFPASVREIVLSGCISRCGLRPSFQPWSHSLAVPRHNSRGRPIPVRAKSGCGIRCRDPPVCRGPPSLRPCRG